MIQTAAGVLSVIVFVIFVSLPRHESVVSQWDPFCKQSIAYKPYISVWRTEPGQTKLLEKWRGPGFIDVSNKNDIYVCSNGVVILYFKRTNKMGDVYEGGEMQWAAHKCQVFNPTFGSDTSHHSRRLHAILLIGDSTDLREPAMQLLPSPYYDIGDTEFGIANARAAQGYVNLSSIVMINSEAECQLTKVSAAGDIMKIMVYILNPNYLNDVPHADRPTVFCRLDAQRDMGQHEYYTGIFYKNPITMPLIAEKLIELLFNNEGLRFHGCKKFPDYTLEWSNDLMAKVTQFGSGNKDILDELVFFNPVFNPDKAAPFWLEKVSVNPEKTESEQRLWVDIYSLRTPAMRESRLELPRLEAIWEKSKRDLEHAIMSSGDVPHAQKQEHYHFINYHFYPFRYEYVNTYYFTQTKETDLQYFWHYVVKEYITDTLKDAVYMKDLNKTLYEYMDLSTQLENAKAKVVHTPLGVYVSEDVKILEEKVRRKHGDLRALSVTFGIAMSDIDKLMINYWNKRKGLVKMMNRIMKVLPKMEKRQPFEKFTPINIPRDDLQFGIQNWRYEDYSNCDHFPTPKDMCSSTKPTSARANFIFNNIKRPTFTWPRPEDSWRDVVFDLIHRIFHKACPYVEPNVVSSVTRVVSGYLAGEPNGTGLHEGVKGSRLGFKGHGYLNKVYNETLNTPLRPKKSHWELVINALVNCTREVKVLKFYHTELNEEKYGEVNYILFEKLHPNGTVEDIEIDKVHLMEQAEREFIFNWAIDMNWKIFSTVLGVCLPSYGHELSAIAFYFYSLYHGDFLEPIMQIWMSNRDNVMFQQFFGSYYPNGRIEKWMGYCMEAAYIQNDRSYRPLRFMYVNDFSELNFFIDEGKPKTSGRYFAERK